MFRLYPCFVLFGTSVLINPTKIGYKNFYCEAHGAGLALEITRYSDQLQVPVLCIVKDNSTANQLKSEIEYFQANTATNKTDRKNAHPVLILPDWETLPYDSFSPHQDIVSERIETLHKFQTLETGIILVPVSTLIQRLAPSSFINRHSLILNKGQILDVQGFTQRLAEAGYQSVTQVYEHGEFALRGSIVDLFPAGSDLPIRIDFFDNEIDSIRYFDTDTQISNETITEIRLLPAHEFSMNEQSISLFRSAWRSEFDISRDPACFYQQVSQGIASPGIEYYLPFFHETLETLFDYIPKNTQIIELNQWQADLEQNWDEISQRYQQRSQSVLQPPVKPSTLYLPIEEINHYLKDYKRLVILQGKTEQTDYTALGYLPLPDISLDHRNALPLHRLKSWLAQKPMPTLIAAESPGRKEQIIDWLKNSDIDFHNLDSWQDFSEQKTGLGICVLPIQMGCYQHNQAWQIIAESQLYGEQVRQPSVSNLDKRDPHAIIRDLAELQSGALVVHIEQGIGRYLGLQLLELSNLKAEFLTIEYQGGDKFYVPVHNLDQISRYSGASDNEQLLNRLGTEQWSKAKSKAAEKIRDVAAELLEIQAQRAARQGKSYQIDQMEYRLFSAGFPFEETNDQKRTIEAVLQDLQKNTPMDRLVCGDVGFGKTEVAMRAAFVVANAGFQVAILVPTTLLAQQHFENFRDRFADWPLKVEVLSRFQTSKQQQISLAAMADGKIDIIIGTHKLLQKDIQFKDLGLLIVDEEHRFGVRQKEKIKALKANVDILTMTATPIPRTLNMAMSGMRDLSIIATPPQKRLAVKTFVRANDDLLIKDAIIRETRRGGQVYFVHNEVESIERRARELQKLIPELKIRIGHGQMREVELEKVMQDFYHQRFHILLCTTIIETGIDVPNANTIIIDRADHFGLAQLHQLRGRVGRSHHQAYAYLLTPISEKLITTDAQKRLEAITKLDTLGSGFLLASQDLEIRGAGEILGEDQTGQIQSIGFNLYMEMLENAVEALKNGKEPSLEWVLKEKAEVEIQIVALLPDDYVSDVSLRLSLYKRIASASTERALDEIKIELIDRFGLLPDAAKNLFILSRLRQRCNQIGIKKIELGVAQGSIDFIEKPHFNPMAIIQLIQKESHQYRLHGPNRIKIDKSMEKPTQRLQFIQDFLGYLESHPE